MPKNLSLFLEQAPFYTVVDVVYGPQYTSDRHFINHSSFTDCIPCSASANQSNDLPGPWLSL